MKTTKSVLAFASAMMIGLTSQSFAKTKEVNLDKLPVEIAKLTSPPMVPPPIKRKAPARVKVFLETVEVKKKMADGVDYTFWTYGGTVPGPMIRIRQGDYVDFTLANHPSSKVPHNIDLHAVTGQGGGASGSNAAPGKQATFSFRALNPGLYIYHCATAPVPVHIGNGMYGLILVEPEAGMPTKADVEYQVVQGDFYTKGKNGDKGLQEIDTEKMIAERPEYIVFNGAVGAVTGEGALKAKVNDNVRIYFGVGGPNIASNFHVIGEIFDKVWQEAGSKFNENVQTTIVPPGGATMVDMKIETPANYILVDHALTRAFNKGAIGILKVEGKTDPKIYTGNSKVEDYRPVEKTEAPKVEEKKSDDKKVEDPHAGVSKKKSGKISV